jgi:ribonuclease D
VGVSSFEWVAEPAALRAAVDAARAAAAYAIDTEFHRERTYWPRLALVQLAWPGGLVLIDPFAVDLAPLADLFAGPGVAVMHAAEQDLEVLERACGAIPARLFDTQIAAGFLGHHSPSLASVVEDVLGTRIPKGDRISDWTVRPLSDAQLAYAAADVAHLLDLARILRAELEAKGRLAWAEAECEELRSRPRAAPDPETAWWRVKNSRHLRGRSRAVAQCVAAWREREAAATDRPPRAVLPDLALLGIAHRPPGSVAELRALRGLDGRHLRAGADRAIMGAVAAGLALPPERLRLPPTDTMERRLRPVAALAAAWVSQLAVDMAIDPALLATRADIHALLRGDPDARLARGWRAEVVGEPIRRLVAGRAALAFDGKGGLELIERP